MKLQDERIRKMFEAKDYTVKFKSLENAMKFVEDALVIGIEVTIGRDKMKRASYTTEFVTTYTLTFKATGRGFHSLMYNMNDIEDFWTNKSNTDVYYYIWDFPSIREKYTEMRRDDEF